LAALIGASLPITGFLIWYGRKFKKKPTKKEPVQTNGKALPAQVKPRAKIPACKTEETVAESVH
jgi:hypothetical protein